MSSKLYANLPSSHECGKFQSRLFEFLDGELNPVEEAKAQQHLAACAKCRQEAATARRCESALASASNSIASPGDLRAGFYLKLAETQRRKPVWQSWKVGIPAVLAAGLLLFAVARFPAKIGDGNALHPSNIANSVPPGMPAEEPHLSLSPIDDSIFQSESPIFIVKSDTDAKAARARPLSSSRRKSYRRLQVAKNESIFRSSRNPSHVLSSTHATVSLSSIEAKRIASNESFSDAKVASDAPQRTPKLMLASFTPRAELHVSDEERDFMSASLQDTTPLPKNQGAILGIDERNEATYAQPAELPALP